jgi:3-isopropylmalate/(R)-2-methylmalate dehydratase small subunit
MTGTLRPFTTVHARAVLFDRANVDTDQIIPARFLRKPRTPPEGYAPYLFHDVEDLPAALRRGAEDARPEIVVTGLNFGCGSSREGAVYALVDAGVRAIVAESFGDIFRANAARNGLLCAAVSPEDAAAARSALKASPGEIEIGLDDQTMLLPSGRWCGFFIDSFSKRLLRSGQDELSFTLSQNDRISTFTEAAEGSRPWSVPVRHTHKHGA